MSSAAPQTDLPKPGATTEADKAENRTAFIRNIVGIRPKAEKTGEKPADKPTEKPGESTTEIKPGDKPAAKPVATTKKKTAEKSAPALSTEDLATAVSSGVREALKPTAAEKAVEPKLTDKLSDKDKKRYAVFEQMEKNNPENAGLAGKFVANLNKHEEYQKAWEAKHPGKKFDIGEEEHADFVAANDLNWDQDEYVEALTDIKSGRALSKVEDKFKNELSSVKRAEIARNEAPLVNQHQAATAKILFKELGDEFKDVLGENGVINTAEIKRLVEENPIYEKAVFPLAQKVEEFSGELLRIARGHVVMADKEPTAAEWNRMTPTERARHQLHQEIIGYVTTQEQIFSKLPTEQRMNQRGQVFATSDQWEKMSTEQRAKHWTLTDRDLSALYAMDASVAAKKSIENEEASFKKIAEKRGIKLPDKKHEAVKPQDKPADKPQDDDVNRRPPPSTLTPRMATKPGGEKNEKTATLKQILGRA